MTMARMNKKTTATTTPDMIPTSPCSASSVSTVEETWYAVPFAEGEVCAEVSVLHKGVEIVLTS